MNDFIAQIALGRTGVSYSTRFSVLARRDRTDCVPIAYIHRVPTSSAYIANTAVTVQYRIGVTPVRKPYSVRTLPRTHTCALCIGGAGGWLDRARLSESVSVINLVALLIQYVCGLSLCVFAK